MDNPTNDWKITMGNATLEAYFNEITKLEKHNKCLKEISKTIK